MLTTDAINDFKDFIDNIIAYAKVTVNGVSEKKVIHRRERLKDGRVAVYVQITPQVSGTATVQRVQLYNKNNKLWADKAVNIPLNNVQEGVLYRFTFDFTEKEVSLKTATRKAEMMMELSRTHQLRGKSFSREHRRTQPTSTTWKTVFPMQQKRQRLWHFLQSTTSRQ